MIAALLAIAFGLGGGGVRYGLANLAVQLAALAVLAFNREAFFTFWREAPLAIRLLVSASLLLPLAQLVPLPEAIWTKLPGRELVAQSRGLIGAVGWAPASVDPARTFVALTGLIVPLVIVTVGWSVPRRHLMTIGWFVALLGLVCFAIGVPQVLTGGTALQFYDERPPTSLLLGTFANRNSTGVFLISALAMAALLPLPLARPHPAALPVRLGICALLVTGIALTQSRTSLALCAFPIGLGLMRAAITMNASQKRPVALAAGALALTAAALGTVFAVAPGRIGDALERFENPDDPRRYIWDDATYSATRYWPVGTGMGTFDEVFQIDESLENLTERRAGRAHNDFIELAVESGIFGLALAAIWLVMIGWHSWRARGSPFRWAAWASAASLMVIAAQSITDYPLRNQAMLALAAFAMLMLARIASAQTAESQS
jgi:O-antigen ligase